MRKAAVTLCILLFAGLSIGDRPHALAAAQTATPPPSREAAEIISKAFVRHARTGLVGYGRACVQSPSCRLDGAERDALTRIIAKLSERDDWPAVRFDERTNLDGALSSWSSPARNQLVFPVQSLTRAEPQGGFEPLSIFRAAHELVLRVGETVPGASSTAVASSADKLREWLHERAEVARLGTQRRLVAIDLGQRNRFTELLMADDSDVIRLETLLPSKLVCPSGGAPTGARIWSVNWAHGVPGPIFKQPIRGRLNLFCEGGDKLGDDVLFEMNFEGDHLVSKDIEVRILECSKLGCYPKRDTSGVP